MKTNLKKLFLALCLFLTVGATDAFGQSKPEVKLTVDGVQAANLEAYSQVLGSWNFVFANGEDVVATLDVITSGYNHIAGQYDLAGSASTVTLNGEEAVTAGQLSVVYVSEGTQFPVYHFEGTIETPSTLYTLDLTAEVFAYDYLCYLYYEMGAFIYDQILVVLDDAPDDAEHDTYEVKMTTGYVIDYVEMMGAIHVRAENEDGLIVQVILDADELKDNTTYPMSSNYAVYCYLGDMNTQVYLAYFKSGSASLKVVAENTVDVDATLVAKGGDVYHILMTGCECQGVTPSTDIQSLKSILTTPGSTKRLLNGKLSITRNGELWNLDGTKIK